MKKLILIIVLGIGAFFIYEQLDKPASDEVRKVESLEKKFKSIRDQIGQARRSAGLGIDSSYDFDSALGNLKILQSELNKLKPTLSDEAAINRAQELEKRITSYIRSVEGG